MDRGAGTSQGHSLFTYTCPKLIELLRDCGLVLREEGVWCTSETFSSWLRRVSEREKKK